MFSNNEVRNGATGLVLFLALLAVCIGGISLYKSNVPVQVDANSVNIKDADLTQALARWSANAPPVYDITVKQGADQATLHVSQNETNVQVVQFTHAGSPVSNSNMPLYPNLQQMSVQSLFALVRNSLGAIDKGELPPAASGKLDLFYDYIVRFNQDLGYPAYIVNYQRETSATREIVWRENPQAAIEVTDLKASK